MFDLFSVIIISYFSITFDIGIPDSPMDLYITNVTYSTISIKWKAGFNGGWKQTFRIFLDNLLWNETDEPFFIFTSKFIIFQYFSFLVFLSPQRSSTFRIL